MRPDTIYTRETRHAVKFDASISGLPAELHVKHGSLTGWLPVTLVRPITDYGRRRWVIRPLDGGEYVVDDARLRIPEWTYSRRASDPTGDYAHIGDQVYT